MTDILLITQVVFMAIIVIFVLLQKSSSIGLGGYSGSNESLFGAKGPMNFLAKGTLVVGFLFVCNTLFLGYLYNQQFNRSVVDESIIPKGASDTNAPVAPALPQAPAN